MAKRTGSLYVFHSSIYSLSMLDMDIHPGRQKKEYILVSSDNRAPDSVSTTDFILRLPVPINKVIKTDLVQVAMDYNVANIKDSTGNMANLVVHVGNGDDAPATWENCEEVSWGYQKNVYKDMHCLYLLLSIHAGGAWGFFLKCNAGFGGGQGP